MNLKYEVFEDNKKILTVNAEKTITTYNNYSLPLMAIDSDNSKSRWVLEHFTNIYLMKNQDEYVWLDYLEDLYFPSDVLEYKFEKFEEVKYLPDIVEYLKKCIDNQKYTMVFIDLDCLKDKKKAPHPHFMIQVFVNGYNDAEKIFYGIGINSAFEFDKIQYSYDEIAEGFESMLKYNTHEEVWVDWYTIVTMKIKEPEKEFVCDTKKIIGDIKAYTYSENGEKLLRPEILSCRGNRAVYGMNAQTEVLNSLRSLIKDEFTIDYRAVHLLYEQKNLMLRKLKYIAENSGKAEKLFQLIKDYEAVCRHFRKARMMYMMQVLIETDNTNLYGQLKDKRVIEKIIEHIESASEIEKKVLSEFIELISE